MPFEPTYPEAAEPGINAQRATSALAGTQFGPVRWTAETGSTNDDLMTAAVARADHGTIHVADHQTAGKGRRDRKWASVPGRALQMSILLRPRTDPTRLGVLTAAVGVAAVEACTAVGCGGAAIKWPNDLVVGEVGGRRKLAGMLTQVSVVGEEVSVVVGIGLNVDSRASSEIPATAIALDELGARPSRLDLLVALLVGLDQQLTSLESGTERLWARYCELSATLGTRVRAELDAGIVEGDAVGVTATGALILDTGADVAVEIVAADVVSLRSA